MGQPASQVQAAAAAQAEPHPATAAEQPTQPQAQAGDAAQQAEVAQLSGSAADLACDESGLCSVGKVGHFRGDVATNEELTQLLSALAFKQEVRTRMAGRATCAGLGRARARPGGAGTRGCSCAKALPIHIFVHPSHSLPPSRRLLQIMFVTAHPKDIASAVNAVLGARALGAPASCPPVNPGRSLPRAAVCSHCKPRGRHCWPSPRLPPDAQCLRVHRNACRLHHCPPLAAPCRTRRGPPSYHTHRATHHTHPPIHAQASPTPLSSCGRRTTVRCRRHASPAKSAARGRPAATSPSRVAFTTPWPCAGVSKQTLRWLSRKDRVAIAWCVHAQTVLDQVGRRHGLVWRW